MYGSAIPKVMSKHPGPQPSPEISQYDCAWVNCMQKKAWCHLDGDLKSSDVIEELRQFVWNCELFAQKADHSKTTQVASGFYLFYAKWGGYRPFLNSRFVALLVVSLDLHQVWGEYLARSLDRTTTSHTKNQKP